MTGKIQEPDISVEQKKVTGGYCWKVVQVF